MRAIEDSRQVTRGAVECISNPLANIHSIFSPRGRLPGCPRNCKKVVVKRPAELLRLSWVEGLILIQDVATSATDGIESAVDDARSKEFARRRLGCLGGPGPDRLWRLLNAR